MSEKPILFKAEMVRTLLAGGKTQTRRIVTPQPQRDGRWWLIRNTRPMRLPGGHEVASEVKTNDRAYVRAVLALNFARYAVGDHLWVREGWRCTGGGDWKGILYRADGPDSPMSHCGVNDGRARTIAPTDWPQWDRLVYQTDTSCDWRPSIFMPKWAARLWLDVTEVRCQRLQEIKHGDIQAEGITCPGDCLGGCFERFNALWDSINAPPKRKKRHPYTGLRHDCYVSYPWSAGRETRQYKGLPWYVIGDPWVFAYGLKVLKGKRDGDADTVDAAHVESGSGLYEG